MEWQMQAAIGINQLKLLDNQIKKRDFISNLYFKSLKDFFKYQIFKLPNFKCQKQKKTSKIIMIITPLFID